MILVEILQVWTKFYGCEQNSIALNKIKTKLPIVIGPFCSVSLNNFGFGHSGKFLSMNETRFWTKSVTLLKMKCKKIHLAVIYSLT